MNSLLKATVAGIAAMQAANVAAQNDPSPGLIYSQVSSSGSEVMFLEEITRRIVVANDSSVIAANEEMDASISGKTSLAAPPVGHRNLTNLLTTAAALPGEIIQEAALTALNDSDDDTTSASQVVFLEEVNPATTAGRLSRKMSAMPEPEVAAARKSKDNRLKQYTPTPVVGIADRRRAVGTTPKPEKIEGRKVQLSNVEFEDNTVITTEVLSRIAVPFVGRPITLSDLEELRIRLTQAYIDKGYINSGAVLPDQKVENGNIVYKLVEGTLDGITIEGEGDLREKYISERVLNGATEPFNSIALQENFQLLLDDPLIERVDGQLQALPVAGKSALNLKVIRARPFDFTITGSNHGSASLGEQQATFASTFRNISGRGDALGVTLGVNQNKYNLTTTYEVPLDIKETRVKVTLTSADSDVIEEPLDSLDIESNTIGAELTVSRALKRRVNKVITTGTTLSVRQNRNTLSNDPFSFTSGEEDGRSNVTVSRVWYDWLRRRDKDVLAARATGNLGLEMFGATAHDDGRPDSQFVSAQAQIQYARRLFDGRGQMILRLDGQLASRELLPLERFSLGGAGTVRGYRENTLVRDRGVLGAAELRYQFYRSPEFGTFQIAPFLDLGYGSNKTFFKAEEELASVGLGLLWSLNSKFFGELYFGRSLINSEEGDTTLQDRGVHLKLVAEL